MFGAEGPALPNVYNSLPRPHRLRWVAAPAGRWRSALMSRRMDWYNAAGRTQCSRCPVSDLQTDSTIHRQSTYWTGVIRSASFVTREPSAKTWPTVNRLGKVAPNWIFFITTTVYASGDLKYCMHVSYLVPNYDWLQWNSSWVTFAYTFNKECFWESKNQINPTLLCPNTASQSIILGHS